MKRKWWIAGWGLVPAALIISGCKKEPGEEEREQVQQAGYEMSREAFFRAAESDDLRAMRSMIDGGLSISGTDPVGRSALHAAAGGGAMKSVDFLLDRGVPIESRDQHGRTPLMEAVLRSTPEMVRYLLQQGADPRAKDAEQYKPMMLAVREGRPELVSVLAPYVREDLDDALLAASILGQAGVIDELTNYGASVYSRLQDGRTPLMLAAEHGQMEAVEMLLSIGSNRLTMDLEGRTAAELARAAGHDEVAARLEGAPEEGDFELADTAELAAELAAVVDVQPGDPEESAEGTTASVVEEALAEHGSPGPEGMPGIATETDDGAGLPPLSGSGAAVTIPELEGAVVEAPAGSSDGEPLAGNDTGVSPPAQGSDAPVADSVEPDAAPAPVVMRSYRQRELPLRVVSVEAETASIQVVGGARHEVSAGDEIPGTKLSVVRIERRMQGGKEQGGEPVEVSVVEVEDASSGLRRDLIVGLPALSHEPVALVEDAASGRYYVARRGQRFRTAGGEEYLVDDVRPSQLVLENLGTGEMTTVRLVGPRG